MTDRFDKRAREIVRSLALVAGIEFRGELLRGFRADDAERTIAAALREEASAKADLLGVPSKNTSHTYENVKPYVPSEEEMDLEELHKAVEPTYWEWLKANFGERYWENPEYIETDLFKAAMVAGYRAALKRMRGEG